MTKAKHVKYNSIADQMRSLLSLPNEAIAERLGCKVETVSENRKRIANGFAPKECFWNEERDAKLKKLHADGYSCSQIARMLNAVSRNAVIGRVSRLGLPGRVTGRKSGTALRLYGKMGLKAKGKNTPRTKVKPFPVAPKLPVLPIPPAAEYDRARVSFLELDKHHCKWPVGDPQGAGHDKPLFCAEKRIPGSSYCYAHHARAYVPVRPRQPFVPRVVERETVAA